MGECMARQTSGWTDGRVQLITVRVMWAGGSTKILSKLNCPVLQSHYFFGLASCMVPLSLLIGSFHLPKDPAAGERPHIARIAVVFSHTS